MIHSPGLSQSKVLLKSEKDVLKLRKKAKNKKIVQKSKLGESFQKFRDGLEDIPAGDTKPLVFGRKYSFSLENFNSLSLQEDSSENSAKFSSESFKHINVRSARLGLCQIFNASSCCRVLGENVREREVRAVTPQPGRPPLTSPRSAVASRPGCTATSPWRTSRVTSRTRPSSLRGCRTWRR